MKDDKDFEVIIVGGSYAGLSAAMALGRALRKVLVIDSGQPCNRQTPHSHNFLTQDGKTPAEIAGLAKKQVEAYKTVQFRFDRAVSAKKTATGFEINTQTGSTYSARKLILATGIYDIMPNIPGFAECWGISVIHCPYCHGYEVRNEKTGILANGDNGFELAKLINNWTKDLTLFTNGKSTLTGEQAAKLEEHHIKVVETEISYFYHNAGQIQHLVFQDKSKMAMRAVYARLPFKLHSDIPVALGCELTEQGYIKVDILQRTTIPGVAACGDHTILMRSVANAVASGAMAGAGINKELIEEEF
ncbi:thioredoxin reductase [Adhaeribacter aerolatus]|uniref:Thioredoxin reductase n=1 Tax=Adhaeribacter aerolatus TaxID=670289 RepID=A0A512B115_9BACT|nr:NAD(P)/FAD-dependent oxidoreductase [Adhaeribacter aerolatus]GEO05643.1 thioredoxin reductase [Adhaeribacter aerolatus]